MQTQVLSAPQSRNLTLEQTSFKSVFKSQARRQWLRLNLALRSWSRNTTAKYGNILIWIMSIAAGMSFLTATANLYICASALASVALAAMIPEMTMKSYEKQEEAI